MAEIELRKVKGVHEFEIINRVFGDEKAHREVQRMSKRMGAKPYVCSMVEIFMKAENEPLKSNESPASLDDINLFHGKPREDDKMTWEITALTNDVIYVKVVAEEIYDPAELEKHLTSITGYFEKDGDPFSPTLRNYLPVDQRGAVVLDCTDRAIVSY